MQTYDKVQETVNALKKAGMLKPTIGVILGTGLGRLARALTSQKTLSFASCPHFPEATSIGHTGQAVYGKLAGKSVLAMEGRFHHYEGYDLEQVTYPVRVMKAMGVKVLMLSNASGGLNPQFQSGDIMIVTDHINLMGDSPLTGSNDERLGERFPDMSECYSKDLVRAAEKCATVLDIPVKKGVYVGVKGPQLETAAEYRFLRTIGADAVGMSTVPEVIVARHANLPVVTFSVITDMCLPDALEPVNIERILKTARLAEPVLTRLVTKLIRQI